MFGGTVGIRRLLKLFDKYNIKTTFFIPGHTLDTFPEECALIRDAGHEMFVSENPKKDLILTFQKWSSRVLS